MADVSTEVVIATTTVGTARTSINFNSIPNTYTDLRLVFVGYQIDFSSDTWNITLNTTSSGYSFRTLKGNGTSATSTSAQTQTAFKPAVLYSSSSAPSLVTLDFFSYAGATYKSCLMTFNSDQNGSGDVTEVVGLWSNTSAITSIELTTISTARFAVGTTATLYGIL